jgi:tetratricopeptide (TPR) repeat protein
MRALAQLAGLLRGVGLNLEAIKHYEDMLALNPNDNQGVRDPLLGLYLGTGNLEGARKLLKKYERDSSANFAWARVLERFLSGDLAGAAAALKTARKANRFVELYLSGQKGIPKQMPDMYSPGSDEEAILVLDNMSFAWAEHKEAVLWLMQQLMNGKVQKTTAVKTKKRLQ